MLRRLLYLAAIVATVSGGVLATSLASSASTRSAKRGHKFGGITVYQAKGQNLGVNLGPQSNPTTLIKMTVPAGRYYVSASIEVAVQPTSFIVCAVSSTGLEQFGVFNNQAPNAAVENVQLSQTVKLNSGHDNLQLTCDDNNHQPGNNVGGDIVDAIPINSFNPAH